MPERRALLLSAHQAACFRWRSGTVSCEASFENTPEGVAAFSSLIAGHRESLYTVVANLAEESFQAETIPFLQNRDRSAVISRKLSQLFYTTPYTAAYSLGYEKTRRKDERLLLAALTAPAILDPWIGALRAARIAITGIHSLPILGESLLKKLAIADERCILLTTQDQSIRETYFERGKLIFSRLSSLAHSSIGGVAQGFATEAVKLQQYLLSQRLIARNQPLRAIVVTHPQAMSAVTTSCISTESLTFDIISGEECARRIGLRNTPAGGNAEALFAHLAIAAPPAVQFAASALRHDYRLWQLRTALYGLGVVGCVGCLLFAGKQFYTSSTLNTEIAAVSASTQDARTRYESILRTFPTIPADNDTLRQIVGRYAALEKDGVSPEPVYREISAALAGSSGIDIDAIDWKAAGAGQGSPQSSPQAAGTRPEDRQLIQVRGTVELGHTATPRQTLAAFERFVADLRATAGYEIKVLQQPFDVDSGKSLKSSSDSGSGSGPRPFALEILRGSPP